MRFACQSCGKAYNLPEEKIAEKSNVKLKCRVCGAIVEVKKHGELVAQILSDGDGKRTRVSEAPAPLTSISPDEPEEATQAIAVTEGGLPFIPPASPSGFGASTVLNPTPVPPPLGADGSSLMDAAAAPPLPPLGAAPSAGASNASAAALPPLAPPPVLPAPLPPPPLRSTASTPAPAPPPPPEPPVPEIPVLNGSSMSNGSGYHAPAEPEPAGGSAAAVLAVPDAMPAEPAPAAEARGEGHSNSMLAATFLTGLLIGIIVALAFF